jgi:hypothetical protein
MAQDDAQGTRTLFTGIIIGFAVYALSFVAPFLIPDPNGQYVSIALLAVSMVFVVGWFIAWKRGFRVGKPANRLEKRAKEKQKAERQKKMKLMRR